MNRMKKQILMGTLAGWLYRLYSATWSYRVSFATGSTPVNLKTRRPDQSYVFGHWHGDELALIGYGRQSKFLTLSSQSRDGSIMAAALKVMGFKVARGSSSRGGMRGLVSMIRMLRHEHYFVSFAVDGPTGRVTRPSLGLICSPIKPACRFINVSLDVTVNGRCTRPGTRHMFPSHLPKSI
jgi:lysophospholipid acyltransferase (LPLAT)-like uncharacterized protein